MRSSRRHSRKSRTTRGSGSFVRVFCVSITTRRSPSGSGIVGARSLPDHVVPARANPDRDGERQPARERQARVLEEHAAAELHVERQAAQPRQAAAVAQRFLVLLDAAERGERLAPRLVGREPLRAHQPVGFHLDVKPELVVHP